MRVPLFVAITAVLIGLCGTAAYQRETIGSAAEPDVLCAAPDGRADAAGTCWDDPLDLSSALNTAKTGSEVWVSQGTYSPGDDPHAAFYLPDGVSVIGGFTRSREDPGERSIDPGLTVFDGQEQSYTILIVAGVSDASLSGISIRSGAATLIADEASDLQRRGGGIYVSNSDATFREVTLEGNYARFGGGGMYVDQASRVVLEEVTFRGNQTTHPQSGRGGGLRVREGMVRLTDVMFEGNRAIRGGGLFVDTGQAELERATFVDNEAADRGGGISVYSGSMSIVESSFSRNLAIREGAGLFVSRAGNHVDIRDSIFVENRSGDGGAGAWIQAGKIELNRVEFLANSAGRGPGGGLYSSNADLSVTSSRFQGNQAGLGGGAALRTVEASILNSLIAGNYAGPPEQMIDLQAGRPPSDDPHRENVITDPWRGAITGEIFSTDYLTEELDERAELAGGGLLAYGVGAVRLVNSTVAGNRSEGFGAGFFQAGDVTIEIGNSIVFRNMARTEGVPEEDLLIYLDPDSAAPFLSERSILESGCPEVSHASCLFVSRDDPLFLDVPEFESRATTDGNFQLWFTSPAVDAGRTSMLPESISEDLAGNPRTVQTLLEPAASQWGNWIDLGALELQVPEHLEETEIVVALEDASVSIEIDVWAGSSGSLSGSISAATADWAIDAVTLGRIYRSGSVTVIDGEALLDDGSMVGIMVEIRQSSNDGRDVRVRLENGFSSGWISAEHR